MRNSNEDSPSNSEALRHAEPSSVKPHLFDVRPLGEEVLCFELKGTMTLEDQRTIGEAIMDECQRRKCGRALADARQQAGDLSIIDWHELATQLQPNWPRDLYLAIVDRADRLKPDRFLETVARNRGVPVRVFSDMDEAVAWLNS